MLDILDEIFDELADLFYNGIAAIIQTILKKHFLIRLPMFSILWLLYLILFPIYIAGYIFINFEIDTELFVVYAFSLIMLAVFILYPHQIKSDIEQYKWIKENLKRGTYISFFDEVYVMHLTDVMAFKLRWT